MKILIVASWFPDAASPFSGIFIAEQARALAETHEVTVLSTTTLVAGSSPIREVTEQDGYRLVRVGVPARNLLHHIDYARAVVNEIRVSRCDVVRGPFAALMETPRDRLKVRFALERADEVIAVSSFLAAQMHEQGITRSITVVPNVVDTSRFSVAPFERKSPDRYRLLFAGILRDDNKNLPLLLHAMKLLSAHGDYHLTVAGDGEIRLQCEQLALELGLSEQCRFLGAVAPERLRDVIAASDVLVLPSKAETFGIVAAEALSVGRPVVATRCGGPEDFVTDDVGVLVANDDSPALAEGIESVCVNLERFDPHRLAEYARSRFGNESIVSRLTEIYARTAGRNSGASRAAMLI